MFDAIKQDEEKILFRNATGDKFRVQCDSKVFVFLPRSDTLVPISLAGFLYVDVKERGVYFILKTDTEEQIKQKEIEALRLYKTEGYLAKKIAYWECYYDAMKAAGKSFEKGWDYRDAVRFKEELAIYLDEVAPQRSPFSFLNLQKENELKNISADSLDAVEKRKPGRPRLSEQGV